LHLVVLDVHCTHIYIYASKWFNRANFHE